VIIAAILYLGLRILINRPLRPQATDIQTGTKRETESVEVKAAPYESLLKTAYPILSSSTTMKNDGFFSEIWRWISKGDLRDPKRIIACQMPFLYGYGVLDMEQSEGPEEAEEWEEPEDRQDLGELVLVSRSGIDRAELGQPDPLDDDPAIVIDGEEEPMDREPEIPDEIKIIVEQIKDDLPPLTLSGEGPLIMIYHTHSREAYKQDSVNKYQAVAAFRSNDPNYTVVKVGESLAGYLQALGIPVLHDKTEHERDDFNKSYYRSLETLQKRMQEFKSLQIFIDIHRNAYEPGTRKADDEVVIINGERVAKIMVVIGTGKGYVGGFKDKPNWQENAKLAIKLTNKVNELYPGLAKPVYYKDGRYNQHISTKAILIEIGSNLTTMQEAVRATKYLAEAISQIIE